MSGDVDAFQFKIENAADEAQLGVNSLTVPEVNRWYHLVGVFDGISAKMYIDGILDATTNFNRLITPYTGSAPLILGTIAFSTHGQQYKGFLHGALDEVAIYNRALTPTEIQQHYQNGLQGKGYEAVLEVAVDIKPGSFPNSINLCSNGTVPVAILGSDTFDVVALNTETLRFAEAAVKVVGKKDPHTLCSCEDVNGDFYEDLVCQYVTADIAAIDGESSVANVNGELFDGTPIEGTDSVHIVKDTCN